MGSSFFGAEGFLLIVAYPDTATQGRRKAHEPCVGEVICGAGLTGYGKREFGGGDASAVHNDFAQHRSHDARGPLADNIFHVGKIFFQYQALIVGNPSDGARSHANAVIGKDTVSGGLLDQGNFRGAQSNRQVRRNFRGDAESRGVFDDTLDSDFVGEFQCGNVARLRQGAPQSDDALIFLVVVVRSVGTIRGFEADGFIENCVIRAGALIDDGGVNVRLERRTYLPQRLRSAVEL